MKITIDVLPSFSKEAKQLNKKYASFANDFQMFLEDLEKNPYGGVDLGKGLKKLRMRISSKGKGKSGGARIITFNIVASANDLGINLLYIYDKSECENISQKELLELLKRNYKI